MIKSILNWLKGLRKDAVNPYKSMWSDRIEVGEIPIQMQSSNSNHLWVNSGTNATPDGYLNFNEKKPIEDKRIEKKPVDIFKEIFSEMPKFEISNLDKQIQAVEHRKNVLKDHMGLANFTDETEAINILKARKNYLKYGKLFSWPVTNQAKINELCSKYKVRMVNIESFFRNLPMEAVDEMEKYALAWTKVIAKSLKLKPGYKLIIDEGGKETKKDPILLATSPFGKWYYVLGAWDKEVEIVDDLIYNGK